MSALPPTSAPDEVLAPKVSSLSASTTTFDPTCATYRIMDEDHTLGNSLRYMVMKNREVEFCGYSIPHPSEAKLHFRVQCYHPTRAIDAMNKGLDDLTAQCEHILAAFEKEFARGKFVAT